VSAILEIGRIPASDLDCEAAVLSACLLAPESFDRVQAILHTKHFYADANRRVYEAIADLTSNGRPVDVVTVAAWLRDREKLQAIGGTPYLAQLSDATPAVAHVEHHAQVIVDKWAVRQVVHACQVTTAEGFGNIGQPVPDWLQEVDARIYAVTRRDSADKNMMLLGAAAAEETERIRERKQNKGVLVTGITTGIPTLDARIGGMQRGCKYVLAARAGMGKAQPLSAKVLTPFGWTTMGELQAGDVVIGANGKPAKVRQVFERGVLPVFKLTLADGGTTTCCDDHLWLTRTSNERKGHHGGTVRSLREIRQSLQRSASGGLNHSIPYVKPIEFASTKQLPLDPYVLGVYIGDGCKGTMISNPEPSVQRRFYERLPSTDRAIVGGNNISVYVARKQRNNKKSTFAAALEAFGMGDRSLAEKKYIPVEYLHAPIDDRLELLRGLCDTDGFVANPKNVEYTTVSKRLADDLQELVWGLGGRISCCVKRTTYSYLGKKLRGQDAYRMVMSFPNGGVVPVSSEKNLPKWDPRPVRVYERFIKRIESSGEATCRCIELESDEQLYVTDDYIVTHNTSAGLGFALAAARKGHGVVFCSLEMPRDQLALRALSQEANIDGARLGRGKITDEQFKDLVGACVELGRLPLVIFDQSKQTVASVRSCIREGRRILQEKFGDALEVGLVVIDFLQIMDAGENATFNEDRDLGMITLGTAQIAKDENCAVLELSQLNRDLEKRPRDERRPKLPDLRGSGKIEENTFSVIFLYRDDEYKKEGEDRDNLAEFIVAKLRQGGAKGIVRVKFKPETTTFYEASRNPDYSQLGDIFDDYIPGQSEPTPEDWHQNYDR
jgi:replicative DNA helicase